MDYPKSLSKLLITERDLRSASRKRHDFSNKYSNGKVLIIGGSSFYYGAPVLTLDSAYNSLAALRVGAGYVKAFVPSAILQTARTLSPNTIIQELGKDRIIFNNTIKDEIEKADVIIIGMGLGPKSKPTAKKIIEYALSKSKKIIADADAIDAVKDLKITERGSVIITPHEGEFYRFSAVKPSNDLISRVKVTADIAKKHNLIAVLKGHNTIITDGSQTKINRAKSAALATMGTGDVLSGIIGGYAAIGNGLFESAVAGVYLHSVLGEILYKEKGNHIIATDIIERISGTLKKFDKV